MSESPWLVAFVEDLVPWLFTRSATALNAEAAVVDYLVEVEMSDLHAKLRAASVRPALLVAGWLTRLGVTVLPGEGLLRLWDAIILEGADVLSQSVLAFLQLHGTGVLNTHSTDAEPCSPPRRVFLCTNVHRATSCFTW
jgi:hypothetical protein